MERHTRKSKDDHKECQIESDDARRAGMGFAERGEKNVQYRIMDQIDSIATVTQPEQRASFERLGAQHQQ